MSGKDKENKHRCPLCGRDFDEGEVTACDGCPLKGNCELIKCPNCGYEFIPGVDERN